MSNPRYLIEDNFGRLIGPFDTSGKAIEWALQRTAINKFTCRVLVDPADIKDADADVPPTP